MVEIKIAFHRFPKQANFGFKQYYLGIPYFQALSFVFCILNQTLYYRCQCLHFVGDTQFIKNIIQLPVERSFSDK